MGASRDVVATPAAPAAIGPYSQAVRVGDLVFCSGQIALDPKSGQMVGGGDVVAETRQVMANLSAVLEAAGTRLARVVKTTIFLVDLGDFTAVNQVYGESFASAPPARATVQVSRLPRDARVEIEAIAVVD
jgi:2-iminobutanoate/2-iminopropanoate deaminase